MNRVSESEAQSFRVLGLTPDASLAEVRRAFRKQAMHNHPDRNPGDPEAEARFRAVLEAYQGATQVIKRQASEPDPDQRPEPKPTETSSFRQPDTPPRRPNRTQSGARRPVRVQRNLARQILLGLRTFNRMLLFVAFVVGPVLFVLMVIWVTTRTDWF